jgi:sugar O-acyltransferase (sialic acid O-acetyltransferase NeuD family)
LNSGETELVFVVEEKSINGNQNNFPVISLEDFISLPTQKYFNIAISNSKVRERIATICIKAGILPFTIIASNVVIMDNNQIGEGAIISPFATITSNTKIGSFFHANIYSYIAHDCVIGDYVTFAPSVKCNGNIVIKNHAYIGTGAILKQGSHGSPLVVGEGAIVGMGAVVTKNIADFATVVGNPARPLEK